MITMIKRLLFLSIIFLVTTARLISIDFTADERTYYIQEGKERDKIKILGDIDTAVKRKESIPNTKDVQSRRDFYKFQIYTIVVMNYLRKKATDYLKIAPRVMPGSWNGVKSERFIEYAVNGIQHALNDTKSEFQQELNQQKSSLSAVLDPLTTPDIFTKLAPNITAATDKAVLDAYLNYCLELALKVSPLNQEQKTTEEKTLALEQLEHLIKTWQLTLNPDQQAAVQPLINKIVELQKKPAPTLTPTPVMPTEEPSQPYTKPLPIPPTTSAPEPAPAQPDQPYTKPLPTPPSQQPPVTPQTPPAKAPAKPQPPTRPAPPTPIKLNKQLLQTLHDDLDALARRL